MLKWDTYFGGSRPPTKCIEASNVQKKTNMSIMLIPWIVLWTTAAINKQLGCFISIGVCAIIPLIFYRNKKTIYDILTNTLVISISIIMLTGVSEKSMLPLSYFIFSAMWIISCIGNYILWWKGCLKKRSFSKNQSYFNYALGYPLSIYIHFYLVFDANLCK